MKNNLILFALLMVSLCISTLSLAQPPGGGFPGGGSSPMGMTERPSAEEMAEGETRWMRKKLKLNQEQLFHVSELNLEYATKRTYLMQTMMKVGQMPDQSVTSKMQTASRVLQTEKENELRFLLDEKQWAMYQKKKKNMTQDMGMPRPPMGGGIMPPVGGMPR